MEGKKFHTYFRRGGAAEKNSFFFGQPDCPNSGEREMERERETEQEREEKVTRIIPPSLSPPSSKSPMSLSQIQAIHDY
jgi:hypothetical protein